MRNLPGLSKSAVLLAYCSTSFAAGPLLAIDAPAATPLLFACEIRYHFREHLSNAKPGQKKFSAPAYEREALPPSRVVNSGGSMSRIIEGRVPHLPYKFHVKITESTGNKPGMLRVNVINNSGNSIAGFPRKIPNPLTKSGDTSRKDFNIPIDKALKGRIEHTLLLKGQVLTHVDLIVGADDDFLSAFPK